MKHAIGTKVKEHMRAEGISWRALEKAAGVTPATIALLFEAQGRRTQVGTLLRICDALGLSPAYLFDDSKAKKPTKSEMVARANRLLKEAQK